MILSDVMTELGEALDTIPGLRVFAWPGDNITVPAAVVRFPETIEFDGTFGRGTDRYTMYIDVMTSPVVSRSAPDQISPYIAGGGASSVKQALEAYTYSSCSSVRVESVEFDSFQLGEVQYLSAIFTVDVVGPGS